MDSDDAGDFALGMMIEKALDADGKRLFQDGEKAVLKNAVDASDFARDSASNAELWSGKQSGGS